jgi:hypothetical protein
MALDAARIKEIAVFINSHFVSERRQERGTRPPGQLRMLMSRPPMGYNDRRITEWLWEGREPDGELPPLTQELGVLCAGHLQYGTCNCAEEEQRRRPERRSDYIEKKRKRCQSSHSLRALSEKAISREEFTYRAVVGVKEPLQKVKGFIDSMLFPLLITPGGRSLTWERVAKNDRVKTIVVEWECEDSNFEYGDGFVRDRAIRTAPVLYCRNCGRCIASQSPHRCLEERHAWEIARLRLCDHELAGDINERFVEIPVNCCSDESDGPFPHFWHREAGVRCPVCQGRRRVGSKYASVRVYTPLDEQVSLEAYR